MPFNLRAAVALCMILAPAGLRAQATADQAQIEFTVGLGQTSGGGQLWRVGDQPLVIQGPSSIDTLAVSRAFRRTINVSFSGTYFPSNHLGLVGEAQLLGLGTEDACGIKYTEGAATTSDLCKSIDRAERNATSVAVSVGAVLRIAGHQAVHPYLRLGGGIVVTQQSFVRMHGTTFGGGGGPSDLTLFADDNNTTVKPYGLFGGGVVAVAGKGIQFRFEVRDNWVRVPAVTGPTVRQGLIPPSQVVSKHILSFMVGFDIVLERKRGRRY